MRERDDTSQVCPVCALGRQHKVAQTKEREKPTKLWSVIHSDLCGPMQTTCITGERYFITFTDEMSGRVSIYLLPTKDGALAALQAYRARVETSRAKEITALRTDGGGEYLNKQFLQYLKEDGIRHIVNPPYSLAQNALAERMNRTIIEGARCLLEVEFVTGPTGPRKTRAPGPFPGPAPLNGLGRGVFFGIPCPCPRSGHRPTHTPDGSPLKLGGNKRGPAQGMSAGGPCRGAGLGLP